MNNQNNTDKAYVKADNKATIVCPKCNMTKTISVQDFKGKRHIVKIRCSCDHVFKLQLEFRRHFRKDTDLKGTYELEPPAVGGGKATILNLSLSGARFEVKGVHDLKVGQKGSLVFTLDNRKETVLCKQVIVRTVQRNQVGCEFLEDQAYTKELGFYLLP